jgi:hypothetical protein
MTPLYAAAVEMQQYFRKQRWRFCIIGGLAVIRWGEPRGTKDVDFTLLVQLKKQRAIVKQLLRDFKPRIDDAEAFAIENRVVLCYASNDVEIDIALGAPGFEEQVIARSTPFAFRPRCSLVTASAEDIIVLKAIADRDRDWIDVRGILVRQGHKLNWDYIDIELAPLCELKEDLTPMERLNDLRQQTQPEPDDEH